MNEFRQWQLDSAGQQQTLYERFGDRNWDRIEKKDFDSFRTKIALTFFGKPLKNCTDAEVTSVLTTVEKVLELSSSDEVIIGFVFVCIRPKNSFESYLFPLLRTVKKDRQKTFFVEKQPGRIYRGWRDFLENNKLPKGDLCYPKSGFYRACDGRVEIEFRETPSCNMLFDVLDVLSAVGKITTGSLLSVSTFFPMMTPIVLTASAIFGGTTAYSTGRSICQLVDRDQHHQSIAIKNKEARSLWINMSSDIVAGVLIGGKQTLPKLLSSGRLSNSTVTTSLQVLNCISVGVNSFGILSNIATLIIKFRDGTLDRSDIDYFISCCLLVSNLIVTTSVAHEIISELSHHPQKINRYFKMVLNAPFSPVKTLVSCISVDSALRVIQGPCFEIFCKIFVMPNTKMVVQSIVSIICKLKEKNGNPVILLIEIQKLLTAHLQQVKAEINEAVERLRKIYNCLANGIITVNGTKLFHQPSLLVPEITSCTDELAENLQISKNIGREKLTETVAKLTVGLGRIVNADSERKFANVCKILTNDLKSRCDQKIILKQSENLTITDEIIQNIIEDVVAEYKKEFLKKTSFTQKINEVICQPDGLLLRPLYSIEGVEAYAFETNDSHVEFERFVNSAACELLKVDSIPPDADFYGENERIIAFSVEEKILVFYYEKGLNPNSNIGIVLLVREKTSSSVPAEKSLVPSSSSNLST